MFFFKQNYEQIQEIQHILEKCNLNIKDLSETLDLNEKDVNRAMSGSIKQKDLLDKIQNYLLDLLKTRESETRNELAKKSLAELHFLLDYAKENSDSKYDSITLNYVISNYYNLEYVSLRNNREGEENEKEQKLFIFYHTGFCDLYHICGHSDYLCGISGLYQLYRYGKGRFCRF